MECHSLTCALLCSNTAASLGRILLQSIVYATPNTFAPIRSATAYGIPNKPDAIDNAPNVLNAVCHAYPAEYPTPIPPIIPMYGYIDSGSTRYRITNNRQYRRSFLDLFREFDINSARNRWYIRLSLVVSSAMLFMSLLGLPRAMWAGIASMSVCLPFPDDCGERAGKRAAFNIVGCLLFFFKISTRNYNTNPSRSQ